MIFYFSGTGNTRWAAEEISRATGERLLNMAEEINGECRYQPAAGECIGFCFPVHGWRPPLLVRSFINKICMEIPANEQPYCWALCTAGDDIGLSMEYLNRDLASLNLRAESVSHSSCRRAMWVCPSWMWTSPRRNMPRKKRHANSWRRSSRLSSDRNGV